MSPSRKYRTPCQCRHDILMLSLSAESLCISSPLSVVASLYAKHRKSTSAAAHDDFFHSVRQHFSATLSGHLNRVS